MQTNQVNVAELCAELYDGFHYNGQNTDVTIECEDQEFLCHRAVLAAGSAYFEGMYNNNVWAESVTGSVVLAGDDMKAATLLEVLKYLYTGNATITSSNFIDLLHACNYLGASGLQAYCVRIMMQSRPEPIVDLLDVLFFAHRVGNHSLIDVLATCNMTERFKKFFKTKEFLDIPADLFLIILSELWRSPPIMDKLLRSAICRWKVHALQERAEEAQDLYDVLDVAKEISLIESSHSLPEVRLDFPKTVAATPNPSVYVYSEDESHGMKVYRYNGINLRLKQKFGLERSFVEYSAIRALQFVSVHNVGVFSMADELIDKSYPPRFTQFPSANISCFEHGLPLASPPVKLDRNFDLCNFSNHGLYLLLRLRGADHSPNLNPLYDASKQEFRYNEIQRGIYFYNIELDRWFPVPAMISPAYDSCMTVQEDNLVYVISSRRDKKMVQAYDHRDRLWNRKASVLNIHTDPQSCVLDGNIYVSSQKCCERYDPIAGRWENIGVFRESYNVKRIIPYKSQLWQFRRIQPPLICPSIEMYDSPPIPLIDVYDPPTASWSFIKGNVAFKTMNQQKERIVDSVVW